MAIIRTVMAGLGGIAGLVAWYVAMTTTGLWSIFLSVLYSEHHGRILALFVGSLILCGFGGGALVLFLGETLRLFPSREELDQQAKPLTLFSDEDPERRA
jgi:hypothetical protein